MSGQVVRVRLLGPVDVTIGGEVCPVVGLRRKAVLAVLALAPGEVVDAGQLADAVWTGDPPATVKQTLSGHVLYLRRLFRARESIVARSRGYVLNLPPESVDVGRALALIDAVTPDDHAGTVARLTTALGLWRGPSLADVAEVAWLRDQGRWLEETRLVAVERLVEARLALGEHLPLAGELEELSSRYPFREHLHQLLMVALYRCGRQADALSVYRRLHQCLGEELGIEPSPALREAQAAILRQDPSLDLPPQAVSTPPARITPAQLPGTLDTFTARHEELAQLHSHISGDQPELAKAGVVMVLGTAGVGKTTLALHWAHQIKQRFPDGQLFVNLRGFDPSRDVMDPAEAIHGFLNALGVSSGQIPASDQARAGLYRSLLADRRVLIVADNARDEQQVRPLLPGAPGCLVVVTSRNQLSGLVAVDGAQPVTLDRPSAAEARQMLAARLGAARLDAEPDAADDIVAWCARLPLALAVVAARAALAPTLTLGSIAKQLYDAATLDPFDGTDPSTNIRAVFSWSYHTLSEPAARLFRQLGPCPGPDIALSAAASVAGLSTAEVRPLLAELTRAHMLTETANRFSFHELLRAYAIEQAREQDSVEQQAAARQRFLEHLLHTAHTATLLLKPGRSRIDLTPPTTGVTPQPLADGDAASTWFVAEHSVLLDTVGRPPDGHDRHTWQLAWALMAAFTTLGDQRENELVQRAGLRAAQRLGDPNAQAHAHRSLGRVYLYVDKLTEARHHTQTALRLFEALDNPIATTDVRLNLGSIAAQQGDLHQAVTLTMHAHRSYQTLGHRPGQAYAAHNISWCQLRLGDHQQGLAYCQEALDILTEIGDLEGAANAWDTLGDLYFATNEPQQGEQCAQQAIALYHRLGDRVVEVEVCTTLGDRHHRAGNVHAARRAWQQAMTILDNLDPETTAKIRNRLDAPP